MNTKYPWKGKRSILLLIPKGLVDPCTCKAIKCITTNAANINGNKKCNAKNLCIVGLDTLNDPQINGTKSLPINGIADNKLVITVALFIIIKKKIYFYIKTYE